MALCDALSDTPAVLIVGGRQVGKSTLTQQVQPQRPLLTLDPQYYRLGFPELDVLVP